MSRAKLHLIAPAGSCRRFFAEIEVSTPAELMAIVQDAVGSAYLVTGDETVIGAVEDESRGGRYDDRRRAKDIQCALADSDVVAMVALRGGAWFTRILPLIDFSVLDQRTRLITVFGFSELTTLVNIVGAHRRGLGIYDLAPAFLAYGLKRQAARAGEPCPTDADQSKRCNDAHLSSRGLEPARTHNTHQSSRGLEPARTHNTHQSSRGLQPARTHDTRLRSEFCTFFNDVVSIIEGRGSARRLTARIVRGELPDRCTATFVGGNLCVLTTLLGSPYRDAIAPAGRWLVLEEFNERPQRLDRFLAQLTLAGFWDQCEGVLLGDFHEGETDLGPAIESLLAYHLPPNRPIPVLATRQVGHTWPMSPLPLHRELTIEKTDTARYAIRWPASTLRTV